MHFDFNLYSTPLLFGFLQGWIYAVLFWGRSRRSGRLSDLFFGCLLAALSFEIWEYMLGFGGIEILWQELEFFPRNFGLLIPALAWWYLKMQFNPGYRLRRGDALHALPFLLYVVYHLLVFAHGPEFVAHWKSAVHFPFGIHLLEDLLKLALEIIYFFKALRLYRQYRNWAPSHFSNIETISFQWFRNFLLAFLASSVTGWSMTLLDMWWQLDFWHDWWDELFQAGLIYYLGITGYAQTQPRQLKFEGADKPVETTVETQKTAQVPDAETQQLKARLETLMRQEKPWLDPDLSLSDLARQLQTNGSVLSAVINRGFGKNFNDYINDHRVEAVKAMLGDPAVAHLSLLGISMECGFNSKSTFNRAFKKAVGVPPGTFLSQSKA